MRGKTCSIKFSWLQRCPWLIKKVVQSFLAMHRKVTRSQSNHEMFSHLKTTTILLCFDLYKNEFSFAGFSSIVPKTLEGRLFCVLYALIGLPGTCLTLKWSWLEWILQNQVSARRLELNKIIFRQTAPTLELSIQRLKKVACESIRFSLRWEWLLQNMDQSLHGG